MLLIFPKFITVSRYLMAAVLLGCITQCKSYSKVSASSEKVSPPSQAAGAYFKRLSFHDDFNSINTIDINGTKKPGFKWYVDSTLWANGDNRVSNSVLTVANNSWTANWTLSTMTRKDTVGQSFKQGYFEARMRFDPTLGKKAKGWPAFWSLSTSWLKNRKIWAELDFFEAYTGGNAAYENPFVGTLHDWRDGAKFHFQNSNNWIPMSKDSTDYSQWHTYGCMWETGKVTWYFDEKLLMTQLYSSTDVPNPQTKPDAPVGTFSFLDKDPGGVFLILGSDEWPMDVDWVRVWQ
jgi:hypothetical protein